MLFALHVLFEEPRPNRIKRWATDSTDTARRNTDRHQAAPGPVQAGMKRMRKNAPTL